MRLFISHANEDLPLVQALRVCLDEFSEDLDCFLLADDLFAGDDWEARIRRAAAECDAVLSLVTTRYIARPWFVAEWSMFWFQDKPWYLVIDNVEVSEVFEPMRRRQAAQLGDRRSMEHLLRAMPVPSSGSRPPASAAAELVAAVDEARSLAVRKRLEANLAKLTMLMQKGTPNVDEPVVDEILEAGGIDRIRQLALSSDNEVSLRQLACVLLKREQTSTAASLAARISNNAERKNVGLHGIRILVDDPSADDVRGVVFDVYRTVRDPQRRELRAAADRLGLAIDWPDVEANP